MTNDTQRAASEDGNIFENTKIETPNTVKDGMVIKLGLSDSYGNNKLNP